MSHGISSYQFSAQNLSSPFSSKEAWKGVFLDLSIFKVFVLQHHIHKQVRKPSPPIIHDEGDGLTLSPTSAIIFL